MNTNGSDSEGTGAPWYGAGGNDHPDAPGARSERPADGAPGGFNAGSDGHGGYGPSFVPHTAEEQNAWFWAEPGPAAADRPEQTMPLGTAPAATAIPPTPEQPASKRTARKGRSGILVLAVALAALVGGGAGVGSYAVLDHEQGSASSPISISTAPAAQAPTLNGTVEAAAAKIEPSVVTITVQTGSGGDIGSGVVLDKQGHILTNNHVVTAQSAQGYGARRSGQEKITVTFANGKTASASIVGTAATEDLAVIKVDGMDDLTPANFANSSSLKVGQSVVAAGAPLGLSQTVTSGIVSNTARPVRSGTNNDAVYLAVQTDTPINPGNSGGPLVDLNGSVVGINSSIASTGGSSDDGSQSGNIGIGFAIPADVAVRVAGQLIDSGTAADAAMGVTVSGTDDQSMGTTTTGVPLQSVRSGGAAATAGLQSGDVVTKVNDFETTTADGLIAATRFYAPGTMVTVSYTRDGNPATASVTLGSS